MNRSIAQNLLKTLCLLTICGCGSSQVSSISGNSDFNSFSQPQYFFGKEAANGNPKKEDVPKALQNKYKEKYDSIKLSLESQINALGSLVTSDTKDKLIEELDKLAVPKNNKDLDAILSQKIIDDKSIETFETTTSKIFANFLTNIVAPALSTNQVDVEQELSTESLSDTQNQLKEMKAIDIFDDSNSTLLNKLIKSTADKYYQNSKPLSYKGFDKKSEADKIEHIREELRANIRRNMRVDAGKRKPDQKVSDIEKAVSLVDSDDYHALIEDRAQEIVRTNGHPSLKFPSVAPDMPDEELRQKLITELVEQNESFNKDKKVAKESKQIRADRLLESAKNFLAKEDALNYEPTSKISRVVIEYLKQIALQVSNPLGDHIGEHGENTEPPSGSDDIDDYKSSIYAKVRELYKEMGGFGRILGVLGLKGYFAGIIADELAKKLDRVLTGEERKKIDEWSHSLATELHGTEPVDQQRPGPVVQYPPQNPYGNYQPQGTNMMPLVPVMPYGGSHGHKSWHHKPTIYAVPGGMGGYYVVPR